MSFGPIKVAQLVEVIIRKCDVSMDWKIGFYCWYIGYRAASKRNSTLIIKWEEYQQKINKIAEISTIYQFGTDKSTKKLSMKQCTEQRRKLVKILDIYQIYWWYINNISYISFFNYSFLIYFFILNIYYHFIFNYFLYLSHLCMTCSYLQSIVLSKLHVLIWILSSTRWAPFI